MKKQIAVLALLAICLAGCKTVTVTKGDFSVKKKMFLMADNVSVTGSATNPTNKETITLTITAQSDVNTAALQSIMSGIPAIAQAAAQGAASGAIKSTVP